MSTPFAAFVETCEEDRCWADQWLQEAERLSMPFGVHLDRCSEATKQLMRQHPLCVAWVEQDDPSLEYTEQHKQHIFDLLASSGRYTWLLHWNIDEIFEKAAPQKLAALVDRSEDYLTVQWVNCWGDLEHIRIDERFEDSQRFKFYRVDGDREWVFDHPITHGCKLLNSDGSVRAQELCRSGRSGLVCLHTGLMTRELRLLHKERWDRIYTKAVGGNPYGFWNYCLDEVTYPPTVVRNPYR